MATTTGLRLLGRWVGPRRSGLILGLPSTTALVLLGCGWERGVDEATLVAEACLAGLIAAVTLPVAFARAVGAGWPLPRATAAAIGGYLVVAAGLGGLPGLGPVGSLAGAACGVLMACRLVARLGTPESNETTPRQAPTMALRVRCLATRAAVPTIYVVVVRSLRWLAGPSWSGRFVTFPGGSLALLIATHVEAGPASARRLAAAMPSGSFGTLAFLAAFRHFGPRMGLAGATLAGYVAALAALLMVELGLSSLRAGRRRLVRLRRLARDPATWRPWLELAGLERPGAVAWGMASADWSWPLTDGSRRSASRRFAPGLECLAG